MIAFAGVVAASFYALRMLIRSMHNRAGARVRSREIGPFDVAVLAPIVLVILLLAVYPQLALRRSETAVKADVAPAHVASTLAARSTAPPTPGRSLRASSRPLP